MHSNDEGMGESVGGEGAEQCLTRALGVEAVEALTNEALLVGTRRLVCQSNRVLAALLAHLAEVESRGLHRTRACASLYIYCIYELRMSEDAAYRRVVAARLVKRFSVLFGAVERGELHLTALVLLAPHLTEANVGDVLARAKFRTKKEILKLVRLLSPLPDVPSRIEPLGLETRPAFRATWSNITQRWVRELEPDARPENWLPPQEATTTSAMDEDAALVESALARSDSAEFAAPYEEEQPRDALARSEQAEVADPEQLRDALARSGEAEVADPEQPRDAPARSEEVETTSTTRERASTAWKRASTAWKRASTALERTSTVHSVSRFSSPRAKSTSRSSKKRKRCSRTRCPGPISPRSTCALCGTWSLS